MPGGGGNQGPGRQASQNEYDPSAGNQGGGGSNSGGGGSNSGGGNGPYSDAAAQRRAGRVDNPNFVSTAALARAAHNGPAYGSAAWNSAFVDKLSAIPWAKQFPDVASWLASSSLPPDQQAAIVQHYPSVHQWVDSNTALGGTPGVLREAYARALKIQDPNAQNQAIQTLDAFRSLPQNEQSAVLAYMHGTGKYGTPALLAGMQQLTGASQTPTLTTGPDGKPLVQFANASNEYDNILQQDAQMGVSKDATAADLQGQSSETTGASIDKIAVLGSMFPSLQGRVQFSAQGMNFDDLQNSLTSSIENNPFVGHAVQAGSEAAIKLGYGGTSTAEIGHSIKWGHVGYEAAMGTAQAAFLMLSPAKAPLLIPTLIAAQQAVDAPYQLFHAKGSDYTGTSGGLLHAVGNVMHYVNPLTWLANTMNNATGVISRNVFQPLGMGKEAADMASSFALIAILHVTGGLMEGVKSAVATPASTEEISAAAASADTTPTAENAAPGYGPFKGLDSTEAQRAADESTPRPTSGSPLERAGGSWTRLATHAWSYAVDGMIHDVAQSLAKDTGLADLLRRQSYRTIFDTAQAIKDMFPGSSVSDLTGHAIRRFGGDLVAPEVWNAIMDPNVERGQMPAIAAQVIEDINDPTNLRNAADQNVNAAQDALSGAQQSQAQDIGALNAARDAVERAKARATQAALDYADAPRVEAEGLHPAVTHEEVTAARADVMELEAQLKELYDRVGGNDPRTLDAYQALDEAKALQQEALKTPGTQRSFGTGQWKLPALVRRAFWTGGIESISPLESAFRTLLSVGKLNQIWGSDEMNGENYVKQPWFTKFTDRMSAAISGWDDHTTMADRAAKSDAIDRGSHNLNLMLTRFGVPEDLAAEAIGKYVNLKPGEFHDFFAKEIFGSKGLISRFLPKDLPPSYRDEILTTGSTQVPIGGVETPGPYGRVSSDPILGHVVDGNMERLPGLDTDFVDHFNAPSPDAVDMAVNWWKRMSARGAEGGASFPMKALSFTYKLGQTLLGVTKAIMMPVTLVGSLPFVIIHKLASEVAANAISGDVTNIFRASAEEKTVFGERPTDTTPSAQEISMHSISDITDKAGTKGVPIDPREALRDSKLTDTVVEGLHNQLERLRSSVIVQHLLRYGGGEEAVARVAEEMQGGDAFMTSLYDNKIAPQLEKADTANTVEEYLGRVLQEVKTYTFQNDPAMMSYVQHGYIPSDVAEMPQDIALQRDYETQQAVATQAREDLKNISKTDPSDENIAALHAKQAELRTALQRMRDMEDAVGWTPDPTLDINGRQAGPREPGRRLSVENTEAVQAYLKDRVLSGELELPHTVEARRAVSDLGKLSTWDRIRKAANGVGDVVSRPLNMISSIEGGSTRATFFGQRFTYWNDEYGRFLPETDARQFALIQAGKDTQAMYYDVSARSTAERAMRNFFWFAPVTAQLLYHWGYSIPASNGGWVPGLFMMSAKVSEYENFFKSVGLLKDMTGPDGKKTLAMSLPIATFFGKIFGNGSIKGDVNIPVEGIFSHVLGGVPTLGVLPGAVLNEIAPHVKPIEGIAQAIAPYTNVSFLPSDVHSLLGVFGIKLADMTPSYVDSAWDKTHDLALQYAWTSMYEKGDKQPDPNDAATYGTGANFDQAKYTQDWNAWFGRLNSTANSDSKALYAMKFLTGSMNGWYTSDEQQAYYDWYDKNVAPHLQNGQAPTAALQQTQQNWLAAHPQSLAFSISTGAYTGKSASSVADVTDFNARSRALYLQGIKSTMSPDTYAKVLSGMTMQAFYEGKRNATLQNVMGHGDTTSQVLNLLNNWGVHSTAYDDFNKEWALYTATRSGSDINDLIDHNQNMMRQAYGEPEQSVQYRFATNMMDNLSQLKDNMDPATYAKVSAAIGQMRAQYFKETGQPTGVAAGLDFYFTHVLDPYYKAVTPIYAQIDAAKAQNLPTDALYQQIMAEKLKYDGIQWHGQTLPSPDAFSFGKLGSVEQAHKIIAWQSEPISYLSPFQMEKAGYTPFSGETAFWAQITNQRAMTAQAIQQRGYSSGSAQYTSTMAWEAKQEQQIAQQYGAVAVNQLALEQKAPAYRITANNPQFAQNATWQHIMTMVDYYNQQDQRTFAYGTKTDYMNKLKAWIYQAIQSGQATDDKFASLMEELHLSSSSTLPPNQMPSGVPLYNQVFFGTTYSDPTLAQQYAAPSGGY